MRQRQWHCIEVKTTIELPDDLFSQAKNYAAANGIGVNDLIASAVARELSILSPSTSEAKGLIEFPLIPGKADSPVLTDERVTEVLTEAVRQEDEHHVRFVRR